MRARLITLFIAMISLEASGQLLNEPEIKSFNPWQKFNSQFIADNEIEEIRILEEFKPDGEKIKRTGNVFIYRFDEKGRVKNIGTVIGKTDTLITTYSYVKSRLECEVKNDAAGRFSYCYTYQEDGRPSQLKYARLKGRSPSEAGTKISTETYEHKVFDQQVHSVLFNSGGRPYRKEIRYYDENGYLTKYLKTFVMTSRREEEQYSYGEKGYITEKKVMGDDGKYTMNYLYDEFGNLIEEKKLKDEKLISRREYVYRPEDLLLRAELERDELKQAIRILSYSYSFR